ncbi:MAG: tRNA epoxyqueuosine(34) reductase QueG [Clostridium sp.]
MKDKIRAYCSQLGLNNIGFIKCRKFNELREFYVERKEKNLENEFEEKDIEKRINPNIYLEEGKTIISIAFPYSHEVISNKSGFSLYTMGMDYHKVVGEYLKKICEFIEGLGGKAIYLVDSNTLPERYIAAISGVGFIGKNNLLITKDYGSLVFLGEIITDLEIYDDDRTSYKEIINFNECGECEECYSFCPTKAINKNQKNSNICLSYLTQKKELKEWEMKALNGRLFGCDTCQIYCKRNKGVKVSLLSDFEPYNFMKNVNIDEIIKMDNQKFKEFYKITSCGWRGKNILIRNALISKHNYLKEDIEGIRSDSPYVNDYKNRLLNKGDL